MKWGARYESGCSPARITGSARAASSWAWVSRVQRELDRLFRIQSRRTTGGAELGTTSRPWASGFANR